MAMTGQSWQDESGFSEEFKEKFKEEYEFYQKWFAKKSQKPLTATKASMMSCPHKNSQILIGIEGEYCSDCGRWV